jgi:hypothetical protein
MIMSSRAVVLNCWSPLSMAVCTLFSALTTIEGEFGLLQDTSCDLVRKQIYGKRQRCRGSARQKHRHAGKTPGVVGFGVGEGGDVACCHEADAGGRQHACRHQRSVGYGELADGFDAEPVRDQHRGDQRRQPHGHRAERRPDEPEDECPDIGRPAEQFFQ